MDSLAWPIFLAGATFRFWSTLYIGGRKGRFLVSEGPYSMCRNPLYVGTFLIALSAGLFVHSVILGAAAVGVLAGYAALTVPAEERYLRDEIGRSYRTYTQEVPRFLPYPRLFRSALFLNVDVKALHREFSKAIGWMLIPLFGEVFTLLRAQPWWPHWFFLP